MYKRNAFTTYDSFCGLDVCQICILAYKVLLRSIFDHWGHYNDIDFEICDSSIIIQIVKEAPQLHSISHPDMADLFSNALKTKNENILHFLFNLEEYDIFPNFSDAVLSRSPLYELYWTIASQHPRFKNIKQNKDLQNVMMYSAIFSRKAKTIKHVLQFYPMKTFKETKMSLWVDAFMQYPCYSEITYLWKMFFYYDINPCLRNNENCYVVDMVVRYGDYDKLIFLLSYNIPIHRSVIFNELHKLFSYHSTLPQCDSSWLTLLCSYILIYSDFWATIMKYFHSNMNGFNRVKLKSLQPIMDFFEHHKCIPLSLQTFKCLCNKKNP